MAAFNANALARSYGSGERIKTRDVLELWKRQPNCADCGEGQGLDHVIPVRLGGRNHPDNLRNLCRFCNARRGGKARKGKAVAPEKDPKTILTLSAQPELDRGADRSTAERTNAALRASEGHIRAELRRIKTARRTGAHRTARVHLDRLIDYVWFSGPDGVA